MQSVLYNNNYHLTKIETESNKSIAEFYTLLFLAKYPAFDYFKKSSWMTDSNSVRLLTDGKLEVQQSGIYIISAHVSIQ